MSTERQDPMLSSAGFAELWHADNTEAADDALNSLAASAATGERAALEVLAEIVLEHGLARTAIRNLLLRIDDIEEAEQTTLIALARGIGSFKGTARFRTWLFSVATNEAKMVLRRRRRSPHTTELDEDDTTFVGRISSIIADRQVVEEIVDSLDDLHRVPLLMRESDGYSYDEIADLLGLPVGTVRSRLSRARETVGERVRLLHPNRVDT